MKVVVVSVLLSTLVAGCASTVDEGSSGEVVSQEAVISSESNSSAADAVNNPSQVIQADADQSLPVDSEHTLEPVTTESIRLSDLDGPQNSQREGKIEGLANPEPELVSPPPVVSGSGQVIGGSEQVLSSKVMNEKRAGVEVDAAKTLASSKSAPSEVVDSANGSVKSEAPIDTEQNAVVGQQATVEQQANVDQQAVSKEPAKAEAVTESPAVAEPTSEGEQPSNSQVVVQADASAEVSPGDMPRTKDENAFRSQYRLGTGDVISIRVFNEPDMSMQAVKMTEAGSIQYVFLGEILVSGLTTREVEQLITERLRNGYLRNPRVTVTVDQYRPYYIGGEVVNRGSYPYVPGMTVLKAITIAGGFAPRASKSKIFLSPENSPEQKNKVSPEDPIAPGDVITIEESFF